MGGNFLFVQKDVSKYKNMCVFCGKISSKDHLRDPVCPHCGAGPKNRDWLKPPIEVVLFRLQKDYLASRDREVLGQMFMYLWQYAIGKIRKKVTGRLNLTTEVIEEKAFDAATLFTEHYLKKPDFIISVSFGSYLDFQVRTVLYNTREKENDQCGNFQDLDIPEDRISALSTDGIDGASQYNAVGQKIFREGFLRECLCLLRGALLLMRDKLPRRDVLLFLLGVKYCFTARILKKRVAPYESLFLETAGVGEYLDAFMLDMFRFIKQKILRE